MPPYGRGVWASFLQNDVSRIRNQIMTVSPRYNLSPLPGQEGEGGPSGTHGGWSKGFFSSLLRNIFLDSLAAVESRTGEALTALDSPPLAGCLPEFVAAAVRSAGAGL